MKGNKLLIIIGVVLLVVIGAGAFFVLGRSGDSETDDSDAAETQNVKTIQPEDIGLELSLSEDKREVTMLITKLEGIESVEYETSYDAQEEDPESGETIVQTQGAISGEPIEIEEGMTELERDITLGTCSATCRYHNVVSDITFVVKVNYKNGEVGQAEATLEYPIEEAAE